MAKYAHYLRNIIKIKLKVQYIRSIVSNRYASVDVASSLPFATVARTNTVAHVFHDNFALFMFY